jgi:aminoglycoside phosphotransferase (APT) family kinase protein
VTDAGEPVRPTTSTRDRADLRARLAAWLSTKVADASISELSAPSSNGMSSETLLFEAHWREDGADVTQPCAARLAPASDALPVFPVYDLEKQFRVMRLVAERTPVPVPRTLWFEPSADAVGSPFFVMERVTGDVPPDVMPYTFGSWLLDASAADQRRVQDNAVSVLAGIHAVAASEDELAFLALDSPGATPLRRHVAHERAYYEWVAADGLRSPLIEAAFRWLDDHWPATETPATISWGDARIGNMMFRDFRPVAVLDWEMAAVGPPEIDLGWMVFLHRFFQDLTEAAGMPGMPGFMQPDDVASTYEAASGHTPRDLDWFIVYAALRHGIVMSRVARRSIHFGEAEQPDDPDDLILHRSTIESMISRQ